MDIVDFVSSSEDDDIYLNTVANLRVLKTKPRPPQSKTQETKDPLQEELQEEIKCDDMPVRKSRARTRGSKHLRAAKGGRRQRQRKDAEESDSDVEIVSVEENASKSKNDSIYDDNNVDETLVSIEDENYEMNIKIMWRSRDIHRMNIRRNDKFRQIFEHYADLEGVSVDEVLITKGDRNIKKSDTPASINLTVIDILEGGIINKDSVTFQKNQTGQGKMDENVCLIKVQTTGKKSLTVPVEKDETFKALFKKCAEELDVEESKFKLYFDGDLVSITDTPESLDIEDEACFDLRPSS